MERLAIDQFLLSTTLPVLYDWGEKGIDQIATGTLLRICNRSFLITSRHLFADKKLFQYDPAKIAFTSTPRGKTVYILGQSNLWLPDMEAIDVAVFELLDQEAIQILSSGWQFLSEANIGAASPKGTFVLAGYPSARLIKRGDMLGGTLVTLYTERMCQQPIEAEPEPHPLIDMFFHLDDEGTLLDGSQGKIPKLEGMSGASIWEAASNPSHVWSPQSHLKIVGVQSAYRPAKYFRGINWLGVVEIFRKIDPRLGSAIEAAAKPKTGSS